MAIGPEKNKYSLGINTLQWLKNGDLLAGAGENQPIIEIWNITNYKLVKEIDFQDKKDLIYHLIVQYISICKI